jgi:4-hydroxybenzoyl-CoA thioesterase
VFVLNYTVRFGDCDPAGIVYFPRFYDFFHQAMEAWFPAELGLGYDVFIRGRKLGFPAVRSEAEFQQPSRFGETISIELRVTKLGRSSINFGYRIRGPEAELRVSGASVCVCMDLDPSSTLFGRSVELPEDLRERIEAFGVTS